MEADLDALTNRKIIAICRSLSLLPSHSARNRQSLLEYVNNSLDGDLKAALCLQAAQNRDAHVVAKDAQRTKRLCKMHNA